MSVFFTNTYIYQPENKRNTLLYMALDEMAYLLQIAMQLDIYDNQE